MRGLVLAGLLALSPVTVSAENVRVLSGEHEDFTRVVLVFGASIDWKVSAVEDGFVVRFDRSDFDLDLSRVFDRIPRDRIAAVSFDRSSASLKLESTCRCLLEDFRAGENTLALDVKTVPPDVAFNDPRRNALTESPFPLGRPSVARTPWVEPAVPLAIPEPDLAASSVPQAPRHAVPIRLPEPYVRLESDIARQLARAASHGLADLATPMAPGPEAGPVPAAFDAHVRSSTVYDHLGGMGGEPARDTGEAPCPAAEDFDPNTWTGGREFDDALSAARRALVRDIDHTDPAALRRLATTYLGFGFGAEARAILRDLAQDDVETRRLVAVAEIVDREEPSDQTALAGLAHCDDPSSVWAVLAAPDGRPPDGINATAVQQSFAAFPAHLRRQLGPALVERLLQAGLSDAAGVVRRAAGRAPGPPTPDLALMEANAEIAAGETEKAGGALAALVEEDGSASPAALVQLLLHARPNAIQADQILLAEALAFENRGQPVARALLDAAARASARTGDFRGALRLAATVDPEGTTDPLLSYVLEQVLEARDDVALLAAVQSVVAGREAGRLTKDAALASAERLLEIRLPELADPLLAPLRESDELAARQLRAEAAFQRGEPALALSLVAGEPDPKSLELRARSLSALGDHAAAAAVFEQLDSGERASHEAWLSGDAERIRRLGSDKIAQFAQLAEPRASETERTDDLDPAAVSLRQGHDTLARSRESRSLIEAVLSDPIFDAAARPGDGGR